MQNLDGNVTKLAMLPHMPQRTIRLGHLCRLDVKMITALEAGKIEEVVENVFTNLKPPGIAFAITANQAISHYSTRGVSDINYDTPFSREEYFPIGSLTKSFAAAAILLLRDQGSLRLDQSPADFVPELDTFWKRTSIFQLLSMQSGFGEDFGGSWAEQHLSLSNDELTHRFAIPVVPAAKPGTQYFYSNFGYMVLGRVISQASGQDARDFIAQRLITPLGLYSTSWSAPQSGVVSGYRMDDDCFTKEVSFSAGNDGAVFGGLWSSISDVATWIDFLSSACGIDDPKYDHVLCRSSRLEMQKAVILRPVAPPDSPDERQAYLGYGFGLVNFSNPLGWTVGHGGAVPGFGCHMRWSPKTGVGVFAVANLRYADLTDGCDRLLAAVTETAPTRPLPIHPLVATRASELIALIANWDSTRAEQLFAFNFFIDYPRAVIAKQFNNLREKFVSEVLTAEVVQLRGLSAKILINRNEVLTFTVSPFEAALIQEIVFCEARP